VVRHIFYQRRDITIIHVTDEDPQYPSDCNSVDEFYDIWVKTVYSRISDLDVVFTSESYGDEFAEYLGYVEHVLVDIERIEYPVSGTKVRSDAFAYWDLIPREVQGHFRERIAIIGSESTGKSTLTKQLAEHYGGDYVEEYGREYTDDNIASEMTPSDYIHIGRKHQDKLQELNDLTDKRFIFSDTEAIVTKTFSRMYGVYDEGMDNELDRIIKFQSGWFNLYILLTPNLPWDDDGTRDFPDVKDRVRHFLMIKAELIRKKVQFVVIGGEDSFSIATRIIDTKLANPNKIGYICNSL